MNTFSTILAFTILPLLAPLQEQQKPQQDQLEALAIELEEQRVAWNIPGMSFALVQGNQVLMAKGFGFANLESKEPASPDSIFSIGSSTKAFTTAIISNLEAQGKLNWDDPVVKHLPYFNPPIRGKKGNQITLRDLGSHQSGYPRMGVLWAGGKVSSRRILETAHQAEPFKPYREAFLYNNVMFLALGEAGAAADGRLWENQLQEDLLDPLGMQTTYWNSVSAAEDGMLAQGYTFDEETKTWLPLDPMVAIDNCKPAGAIYSSVNDMTRWLQFQLSKGGDIFSESSLTKTWDPHVEIGKGIYYGLGWMTSTWRGKRIVYHGGNTTGYTAMVGLMPEKDLGFVLLINLSTSHLQNLVGGMVWKHIFQNGAAKENVATDLSPYLGRYKANFGPFKDQWFTVGKVGEDLAVDVPGQMNYPLHPPNEEKKWVFQVTDTIAISFETDEKDQIIGMKMFQGGMTFELPREGIITQPEIPLAEFDSLLGSFAKESEPAWTVLIQNNRLALDVPGEMIYELHTPTETGLRRFRAKGSVGIVFANWHESQPMEFSLYKNGAKVLTLPRLENESTDSKPNLEFLRSLRQVDKRRALMKNHPRIRIRGLAEFPHAGVTGEITVFADERKQLHFKVDLDEFGANEEIVVGDQGWSGGDFSPSMHFQSARALETLLQSPWTLVAPLEDVFQQVTVLDFTHLGEKDVLRVQVQVNEEETALFWINTENGDILRLAFNQTVDMSVKMPVIQDFSGWRELNGIRLPSRIEVLIPGNAHHYFTFEECTMVDDFPQGIFELPED